jgi:hypothetical protein
MPLQPGSSQETITDNIAETLESPSFGPGKPRKKRRDMAIAASLQKAGKSCKSHKSRKTVSQAAVARPRRP